jgi:uncharacterized protein (UPF0333 family)
MHVLKMGNSFNSKVMSEISKIKKISDNLTSKLEGQASLEFVLVIPFVILLILTVSHLGLLIYQQNILEQAAREGARVIATSNSDEETYLCIKKVCLNFDQDKLDIKITPDSRESRKVGDTVEVVVSYKSGGIPFLRGIFAAGGSDLSRGAGLLEAKSIMRIECY